VRYVDPQTGIEHLWGIGHLTLRLTAPSENTHAIMTSASTMGLAVGRMRDEHYLALGFSHHERAEVVDGDSALCVGWPRFGAAGIRVGSGWSPQKGMNKCE
jgi:hypothetical protein